MIFIAAVRLAVWRAVAVGAAVLMFAGCSDGGDGAIGAPSATVPTLPPQTTTTNPYAIPDVIDAAYVNRVLAGLDAAVGDIVRHLTRSKALPLDTPERLKGLYGNNDSLNIQFGLLQQYERFHLSELPPVPGDRKTSVDDLLFAQRSCIYAAVTRDYSPVVGRSQPSRKEWVALRPLPSGGDPIGVNPTGWVYTYDGTSPDGQPPRTSPCSVAQ
jgi:hypothetical protein